MEEYGVAPFDQNLRYHGTLLFDSSQTLAELRILPRSTIYMTVDEPNSGSTADTDSWSKQDPEEGFRGKSRQHDRN
jgi:hypothetical protein